MCRERAEEGEREEIARKQKKDREEGRRERKRKTAIYEIEKERQCRKQEESFSDSKVLAK